MPWSSAPKSAANLAALLEQPEVLHQERVEERRAQLPIEPKHIGESHADQAGAHRVPFPLTFGQVEGMRESRQHL